MNKSNKDCAILTDNCAKKLNNSGENFLGNVLRCDTHKTLDKNIQDILTDFCLELTFTSHLATSTVSTYGIDINTFLLWCKSNNVALNCVTPPILVDYVAYLKDLDKSNNTVRKVLASLSSFGRYLVQKNIWLDNFALSLERPKRDQKIPKVLTISEVDKLFSVIDLTSPVGIRDNALFELIYSCGLRESEAAGVLFANLHLEEKFVIVLGKGSKERVIPFGDIAYKKLSLYLQHGRPKLLPRNKNSEYLFVTLRGGQISRKSIWHTLQDLEEKSGVTCKVHTLRHSFATHLLSGGANLRIVQELLGHANLATTQIYTHVDSSKLGELHRLYFPGHKLTISDLKIQGGQNNESNESNESKNNFVQQKSNNKTSKK